MMILRSVKKRFPAYPVVLLLVVSIGLGCSHRSTQLRFKSSCGTRVNASVQLNELISGLNKRSDDRPVVIRFPKGRYDFYEEGAFEREYYISNHDQVNPKKVAFALENLSNVTIDGQGSEFVFHGRMIPFALIGANNIVLKNFSIDFELPAFRQLTVKEVDRATKELTAEIYPAENYRIENNRLVVLGEGWESVPRHYMAFRSDKRLTYQRADVGFYPSSVEEVRPGLLRIGGLKDAEFAQPGEVLALRTYYRPTPGIFVSECFNTTLENVQVHYAEGMGLIAQMSENIRLDRFSVCLRGDDDPRYFTTQADATHFSACKGEIVSIDGLYEGMADDAINVHGTYLKVTKRVDASTVRARYMHGQAWGFKWGEPGDSVQVVESQRMELVDNRVYRIQSIKAVDRPSEFGAKEFEIAFTEALPEEVTESGSFGLENLTWTPTVVFAGNTIRNNRARGALFSTPRRVVCENNLFDHTHGTAILLCGDCNGWFETGACTDVLIRNNRFVNALTAQYQFTNAIISIYPEIPALQHQQKYFHSGIVIENNTFETFDRPLVYAKSTDGLIFRNNTIKQTHDFKPFHWNKHRFFFERVTNVEITGNRFEDRLNPETDIRLEMTDSAGVRFIPLPLSSD